LKKAGRFFLALLGGLIGAGIGTLIYQLIRLIVTTFTSSPYIRIAFITVPAIILFILFFLKYESIIQTFRTNSDSIVSRLRKLSVRTLIFAVAGLLIALSIAFLLSRLFDFISVSALRGGLNVVLYIILGYIGISITVSKQDELARFFRMTPRTDKETKEPLPPLPVKILDTSVIIDGRVFDIVNTGFLEGEIMVPGFVLRELQTIADCPDALKRAKGRRGLELINQFKDAHHLTVSDEDFTETDAVDDKLILLAKKLGGTVVTNDFNLNQVARLQNVPILNLNDLSNAVKPALIAGEQFDLQLIKEGTEQRQGVGYLADGTMVVVENASEKIGQTIRVEVTSMLQTAAGKMIFAKPVE